MTEPVATTLPWARTGQQLFERAVDGLSDADFAAPSRLPGWTNAHVVAHVAANADALGNLASWALTGVETPMYSSPGQRNADIERLAQESPTALRSLTIERGAVLLGRLRELPDADWQAPVRTAQGREVPASEVPWMRCREVFIHAVDLAPEDEFSSLPTDFLASLIADIAAQRTAKAPDGASRVALSVDDGAVVTAPVAEGQTAAEVSGGVAAVAAYLAGRGTSGLRVAGDAALPQLGPWL
ncbi:maleylpyruvate isomerase family mycothiol-dependent enzyme [Flexivirga sp. ID2601S]|uniref:Maleylpyruvate isomerase family mycothiol-dependent enzyme n=1 Tax=Flexivirga aerilata TaxID=1656889 RepID=A0A849AGW7_9MICO|nr:maleylpyruvate isomerase family mycothiol-dependent enzyme [Flexivirga aerilata]NNG39107.1 maleylpyruvate isomerase family mycothiol-dependent enzyme [Flexivirga aerilata]